jgi:FAD/FMN-containing dehydrogenase
MKRRGISEQAKQAGAFGGARHGIAESEYDAASDLNRAQMEAGLLQQGYGQGMAGAQQAHQQQMGLAQTVPGMYQQDIATLGTVGAQQQAQAQAQADATREGLRMDAFEPYERLGFLGQGLTGIMGGYGNQYQFQQQPNPTPLQTALGTGATLAGIYGALQPGSQMSSIPLMNQNTGSDIRLKTDIELTGQSPTGVNIYSFKYKGDDKTYEGVMAQEVPWASIKGNDGYYRVDYSIVDVAFKRLN